MGDLDGSGGTSVALFEAQQHVWYYGTLASGQQLTFRPVQGDVFHVGDGPTLYAQSGPQPAERLAIDGQADHANAAQDQATVQPVFPINVSQYTSLGTSRHMNTTVNIFSDGSLYAVTEVHNGVWLDG